MNFATIAISIFIFLLTLFSPVQGYASMELRSVENILWRSTYSPEQTANSLLFDETGQKLIVFVSGKRINIVDGATNKSLIQLSGDANDLIVQKINVDNPGKTFISFVFNNGGSGGSSTAKIHLVGSRRGSFVSFIDTDSLKQFGWSGQVLSFSEKAQEPLSIIAQKSGVKQRIIEFIVELEWDTRADWVKPILR